MAAEPVNDTRDSLVDVIDAVLDKGLVINADIMVSLAGVELLGIKIRAAMASFETAARYGLEFPSGTNITTQAWKEAEIDKASCPDCGERFVTATELLDVGCPACGWQSARASGKLGQYAPRVIPPLVQ
ncbi:MAG: gas vesicle protein [Actinomycetia bacterium]|nr:gas vesicle protein [Actinomycetes bacterium]